MWFLFATCASILNAGTRLANQHLKLSGHALTITIKAFQVLYCLPFLFIFNWPESPTFYIAAFLTAPLVLMQDRALFNFTAEHGAGAVSRLEPLSVPLVFVAWFCISPTDFSVFIQNTIILIGVVVCIFLIVFFAIRMNKNAVSAHVLKSMIPIIFIMGSINIIAKLGIDSAPNFEGMTIYLFIQSVLLVVLSPIFKKKKENKNVVIDRKLFYPACFLSVVMTGIIILRFYGFILADNPAYVTEIMLSAPFWIILYYKIIKHEEKGDIKSGVGIVISSIVLAVLVVR